MSSNNKQSTIICFLIKSTFDAEISFFQKHLCRISLYASLCEAYLFVF